VADKSGGDGEFRNRRGVGGLLEDGVGVDKDTERNGSELAPHEVDRPGCGSVADNLDDLEAEGRSSRVGGMIPSSAYSQSIWTIVSAS
jgi:hypothetical protein